MEAASFEALLTSVYRYRFTGITSGFTDDGGRMFDRVTPGGRLRVVVYPDDGPRATIHVFRRVGQALDNMYTVAFSHGTPEAVILAALEAAEVAR
jgi:hypothetical protein